MRSKIWIIGDKIIYICNIPTWVLATYHLVDIWPNFLILGHHHIVLCILNIGCVLLGIKLLHLINRICLRIRSSLGHHWKVVWKHSSIRNLRGELLLRYSRRSYSRQPRNCWNTVHPRESLSS